MDKCHKCEYLIFKKLDKCEDTNLSSVSNLTCLWPTPIKQRQHIFNYVIKLIKIYKGMIITRSSNRLVILNNCPICVWHSRIFAACHLWKCPHCVYWNLSYSFCVLKVIFLKSNSFRFIETLHIKMALWEGGRNPPWYRKCWPKLLLTKQTFYLYFFHFCDMKS